MKVVRDLKSAIGTKSMRSYGRAILSDPRSHKPVRIAAKVAKLAPGNLSLILGVARLQVHAKDPGVDATLVRAIQIASKSPKATDAQLHLLANLAVSVARYDLAMPVIQQLSERAPGEPGTELSLLVVMSHVGDPNLRQALMQSAGAILGDPRVSRTQLQTLGQVANHAKAPEIAAGAYESAWRMDQTDEALATEFARALTGLGPSADPTDLIRAFDGRKIGGTLAEAIYSLGVSCEASGRLELAVLAYRVAIQSSDFQVEAADSTVRSLLRSKDFDGAVRFTEELEERFKGVLRVLELRLLALRKARRWDHVPAIADSILEVSPDHAAALASRAVASLSTKYDAGQADLRRALSLAPEDPIVQECLLNALIGLIGVGRDLDDFVSGVGLSRPSAEAWIAAAKLASLSYRDSTVADSLLALFGGVWGARAKGQLVEHLVNSGATHEGDDRAAWSSMVTMLDSPQFAVQNKPLISAAGWLRHSLAENKEDLGAILRLAAFNTRHRLSRKRGTLVRDTPEVHEAAELWSAAARQAPEDPLIRRQARAARRAAIPAIVFSGMPRSGSVFVFTSLINGLGKQSHGGVMAGAFPDFTLCQEGLNRMLMSRAMSHTHLSASEFNLLELSERFKLDRIYVHLRDPRQALLSWHNFLPSVLTSLDPTQGKHYKLPQEYLNWSGERQLDWMIDNWLPVITKWAVDWFEAPNKDYFNTRVLFTTFEEMRRDQDAFFSRILEFYEVDPDLWEPPPAPRGVGDRNFREGNLATWRNVLSSDQKRRCARIVPDSLIERFGWPAS